MSDVNITALEVRAEEQMAPIMEKARAYVVADERSYSDADAITREVADVVQVCPEYRIVTFAKYVPP